VEHAFLKTLDAAANFLERRYEVEGDGDKILMATTKSHGRSFAADREMVAMSKTMD
jgi:hypothetical protein